MGVKLQRGTNTSQLDCTGVSNMVYAWELRGNMSGSLIGKKCVLLSNGLALSPACRLFPEIEIEPESPHVPAPENVVNRMHHHGQEHGFQKVHRDVMIKHDPGRER